MGSHPGEGVGRSVSADEMSFHGGAPAKARNEGPRFEGA